ncbi:hypothetical protein [Rufibacter quisquiliarum]|uniref:Uncharacterized protein n=1 Tax=Rufibacter quisquiliarum TaxID=1549639 RepID=A0A839GIW0_9BACT|nr:hypothetical protein [Rufibacter quisquiliarum]MBA9076689.1 hypothetical protein [Rufibacter quisquiliarum]
MLVELMSALISYLQIKLLVLCFLVGEVVSNIMKNEANQIISVIKEAYPSLQEYSFDKYPTNSSLPELSKICNLAEANNGIWISFLDYLKKYYGEEQVTDNTLLILKEPCYRCAIKNLNETEVVEVFNIQISVLVKGFYIYFQRVEREPIMKNIKIYNPEEFESGSYHKIVGQVSQYFPYHQLLDHRFVFSEVSDVKVPNKYSDEKVKVFDCIFSDRML